MIAKSGWLEVRELSGENSVAVKTCWCSLDNGVLWLYKKPGEPEGRDGLPLHDAVVGECDPPAPFQLAIRCRRSGRVLALTAASGEDYAAWMAVLSEMAREWSDKRRASILNKQLMALAKDGSFGGVQINYEEVKFSPRRKSEIVKMGTFPMIDELEPTEENHSRRTLKDIVDSAEDPAGLRWAKLEEVKNSGLLGLLSAEHVALEELKFAALVEEFRYLAELKRLIHLATRAVSWDDPLVPPYHKRAIVNSLHKVRKSSEAVLRMAERHWSQKVTLQNAVFTLLGHEARVAAWQQTYTEFCSHLSELRSVFNRSIFDRPEMKTKAYSQTYQLELGLVPLQHLTSQRQLMQTIFELLPPSSPELPAARSTRDFLNEILDSCYQELTELDGSEYVAEMDNALHFDLSQITPVAPGPKLLPKHKSQEAGSNSNLYEVVSDEDGRQAVGKMTKTKRKPSLIDAFKSATANLVRRYTSEGSALKDGRRASMPAFAFAPTNESEESSDEEASKEPEDDFEAGKVVPRFFIGEPLYQDYLMAIAEETADKILQNGMGEDSVYDLVQPDGGKGCTQWFGNIKVQISGLLGKLSDDERELSALLYELVASEAAYLKSLRTLDAHFVHNTDFYDDDVLPPEDRHLLLSGIEAHRSNSERLLYTMERCWEKDLQLNELCAVIHRNAISGWARAASLACYNQRIVAPTLQRLIRDKREFADVLTKMESSHVCGGFTFLSYLTLPVKRMGRVKLLLENIKQLLERMGNPQKMGLRAACERAHAAVDRLICRAETAAKKTLSDQSLHTLSSRLSFNRTASSLALTAEGRLLVHHGDWRILGRRENGRGAFKAKVPHKELLAFLLTDLLLLVDPQESTSGGRLEVVEYSARSDVQVRTIGPGCQEPMPGYLSNDQVAKDALYLSFRDQSGKSIEMVVGCEGPAEKARWLGATRDESSLERPSPPPRRRQPAILKAVKAFSPSLPDELMLTPGDIIALLRNPGNGWVQGKSILDGYSGWFPKELTVQLCAGRKSVTFLVDEDDDDDEEPTVYSTIVHSNRFSVA